ncbi:thioesterase [Pedobacter psychrotolerans]|nr:thioesterase [Pedobacter psychrotolerans]
MPFLHDFNVKAIELPGRGRRSGEKLLFDFDLAATDLYNQILENLNSQDFIIFGHSMGAKLSLRIVKMLENANKYPLGLYVSGNAGPDIGTDVKRYLLNKDEFIQELKKIGGVSVEFLENEELFSFFEPILRADFELSEKTSAARFQTIKTPIYAIMGSQEPYADRIENWKNFTSSEFLYKIMEGDHFFIQNHANAIINFIRSNLISTK